SASHPALLPIWAPWDFSPVEYLATTLTVFWFARGLVRTPEAVRPPLWRRIAFGLGVALLYFVLQTRFEYWSQHMFFLNRIQHVAMHHLGPFLIALGCPGQRCGAACLNGHGSSATRPRFVPCSASSNGPGLPPSCSSACFISGLSRRCISAPCSIPGFTR